MGLIIFSYMNAMYFEHICSQLPSLIPFCSHLAPSFSQLILLELSCLLDDLWVTLGQLPGAWVRAVYGVPLPPTHYPLPESMSSLRSMTGYCRAPSLEALGRVIITAMSLGLFLLGLSLQSAVHTTPLTVKFFTTLPPREPRSLSGRPVI